MKKINDEFFFSVLFALIGTEIQVKKIIYEGQKTFNWVHKKIHIIFFYFFHEWHFKFRCFHNP